MASNQTGDLANTLSAWPQDVGVLKLRSFNLCAKGLQKVQFSSADVGENCGKWFLRANDRMYMSTKQAEEVQGALQSYLLDTASHRTATLFHGDECYEIHAFVFVQYTQLSVAMQIHEYDGGSVVTFRSLCKQDPLKFQSFVDKAVSFFDAPRGCGYNVSTDVFSMDEDDFPDVFMDEDQTEEWISLVELVTAEALGARCMSQQSQIEAACQLGMWAADYPMSREALARSIAAYPSQACQILQDDLAMLEIAYPLASAIEHASQDPMAAAILARSGIMNLEAADFSGRVRIVADALSNASGLQTLALTQVQQYGGPEKPVPRMLTESTDCPESATRSCSLASNHLSEVAQVKPDFLSSDFLLDLKPMPRTFSETC
mmetsp:Transcript_96794/g.172192  ORF Transcript_96794/g.172192 Transcript_96794/m.172192 type:complete len:375 (+) Transcript_96794:47-1171(+)|eukprot:CAMPEP_0197663390 /NCGR_PEP_ID=MMETSP1338-20131121/57214_1 /TAXON_ID=43686 ORGANISM="Pelagodinium beii, Strain RCC1491" /NCGR_SAMPLE_ID=MMETSP1338 /ASSEMBLY_ACC=CAM_ASM_000754 /LENGTH=374 /DNA_ID=CAMNT_0043241725 /DNA_START=40 /DNA_END=1164 /DNA_ORIENTATION=-